jgi:hypothetical protein
MGSVASVELARLQEAADILSAEAVAHTTNALTAQIVTHFCQDTLDDWVRLFREVVLHPVHDIEALGPVQWDCVAIKQVWQHNKVSRGSKLIRNELGVDEAVADDIRENENCILG